MEIRARSLAEHRAWRQILDDNKFRAALIPSQNRGAARTEMEISFTASQSYALLQAKAIQKASLSPLETRRKAVAADALPADGTLPVKKADVIEFDTELLREETITPYGEGHSIEQVLRRQRASHAQALLLLLPTLANWSRDPQLSGQGGGFTAVLERS